MTAFAPVRASQTDVATSFIPANAIAAGHAYTISFGAFTASITAVTASNGDTIVKAEEAINATDGNMAAIWYCASSAGGTPTFTVTSGGTTAYTFTEWNQAFGGVRSGGTNGATAHTTAISSGAASATAGDVAVGAICTGGGNTFSGYPTSGWTDLGTAVAGLAVFEYDPVPSTGSVTASATIAGADGWSAAIAVFTPLGSSPVTVATTPATTVWAGAKATLSISSSSDIVLPADPAVLVWAGTPSTVDIAEVIPGSGPPAIVWAGTPVSIATLGDDISLVVEVQAGNLPPRNQVTVTGASGASITVTRTASDGVVTPVRGADPAALSGGEWIGLDYEMPYADTVTYAVADGAGHTASAVVAPTGVTQAWLVHPGVPALSQPLNRITLSGTQNDTGATQHVVLGRKTPIAVTDGTRKADQFTLGFRTATSADEVNMDALLRDTTTLLLQVVYPFTPAAEYMWIQLGQVTKARVAMQFGDPQRVWSAACTVTDRPVGDVTAERQWADVLEASATWRDVFGTYATWAGVLTGVGGT